MGSGPAAEDFQDPGDPERVWSISDARSRGGARGGGDRWHGWVKAVDPSRGFGWADADGIREVPQCDGDDLKTQCGFEDS